MHYYDPAPLLLTGYPREVKNKNMCPQKDSARIFVAALFIIANNWKAQAPLDRSTDNKLSCAHVLEW